jgi:hypothetical protein
MRTGWFEAALTFRKCTEEKFLFILLCLFDLTFTIVAVSAGLTELNPVMRFLISMPVLLLLVKLALPVLIAWLIPGRLLWPSLVLLALVAVWNIKEMVIFYFF